MAGRIEQTAQPREAAGPEWHGAPHQVEVVENGYIWRWECYGLLSVIARPYPEMLMLPSICAALNGPDPGPPAQNDRRQRSDRAWLLSVTLCTIVIAMRLGVPLAQISRGALSLVSERTLRHRGIEAKVLLASAPCSFDRMLVKAVALGWVRFEKAGVTMQAIRQDEGVTHRRVAPSSIWPSSRQTCPVDSRGSPEPTLTADRSNKSRHRMLWSF